MNYLKKLIVPSANVDCSNELSGSIIQNRLEFVTGFVKELGLPEGARVLDLRCDVGAISKKKLELENTIDFYVGDLESMDLEEGIFDLALAVGLIEHLRWDRFALQEMKRVLRPGGYLLVIVPNKNGISYYFSPFQIIQNLVNLIRNIIKRILKSVFRFKFKRRKRNSSISKQQFKRRLYSPLLFKKMLTTIGFEFCSEICHGFIPSSGIGRFKSLSIKLGNWLEQKSKKSSFLRYKGNSLIVMARKPAEIKNLKEHAVFREIERGSIPNRSEKEELAALDKWMITFREYAYTKAELLTDDFFSNQSILVLSPHPDDEIIGCGGTLLKALVQEATITILQLTDGSGTVALAESSEDIRKKIRLEEAETVARALGAKFISWKESARVKVTQALIEKMKNLINDINPDLIFVPFVGDTHPDHVMTSRVLAGALKKMGCRKNITISSYEVWGKVPPKNAVVIDEYLYEKERLLMKYPTGMKAVDYINRCLRRDALNSVKYLEQKGFAELFISQSVNEYITMVEQTEL